MLLNAIFYFIKKVFSFITRVIAWLLISLSLWVPFLYSLVFVIILAASKTPISEVSTYYYLGLIITFLVSFAISHYLYERKMTRKKGTTAVSERVTEKTNEVKIEKKKQIISEGIEEETKENIKEENREDENSKFSFPSSYKLEPPKLTEEIRKEDNSYMVFALRRDPTIFIYEYSDRLDYYKKTRQGMIFIESKRKG